MGWNRMFIKLNVYAKDGVIKFFRSDKKHSEKGKPVKSEGTMSAVSHVDSTWQYMKVREKWIAAIAVTTSF